MMNLLLFLSLIACLMFYNFHGGDTWTHLQWQWRIILSLKPLGSFFMLMLSFRSVKSILLKKLCHNFRLSLINREANPSPTGNTITAGIFSKRIPLSHLLIFFILMRYFWLHAHNSYSSFLRRTLKAVWQKDSTFLAVVLYFLSWC